MVWRALSETVRHCWPAWRHLLSVQCTYSVNMARLEAQRRQADGEVVAIDWATLYANHRRVRVGQVVPSPMYHGASHIAHNTVMHYITSIVQRVESTKRRLSRQFITLLAQMPAEARCLVTGLDGAGKSLLLDQVCQLEVDVELMLPTNIGFQVERITYKQVEFLCWDVGTSARVRPLFRHYNQGAFAQIFVVDSSDRARVPLAVHECCMQRSHPSLGSVPLLIFANKQDLPSSMSCGEIANEFDKRGALIGGMWCVQGCAATSAEGLHEGLAWLTWAVSSGQLPAALSV
jgi:GTPase SAR1 family protein